VCAFVCAFVCVRVCLALSVSLALSCSLARFLSRFPSLSLMRALAFSLLLSPSYSLSRARAHILISLARALSRSVSLFFALFLFSSGAKKKKPLIPFFSRLCALSHRLSSPGIHSLQVCVNVCVCVWKKGCECTLESLSYSLSHTTHTAHTHTTHIISLFLSISPFLFLRFSLLHASTCTITPLLSPSLPHLLSCLHTLPRFVYTHTKLCTQNYKNASTQKNTHTGLQNTCTTLVT